MLKIALEILKELEKNNFEAYIVGGFVRDYLLKKDSYDIDICTNARPKELIEIFKTAKLPKEKYGSVTLLYKDIRFEITTFRKELEYKNRKPIELIYTNDFIGDIKRRDFTINTLCMNSKMEIIDLLNGKEDLKKKIIKVVGNIDSKFFDDPLRILRAIRFATQLNFNLSKDTIEGIKNNSIYLKELSYNRKKEELDKIFSSKNIKYGIKLLKDFKVYEYLEINNIDSLKITKDLIGIWAQIDCNNLYPFSNIEKEHINSIKNIIKNKKISNYEIYKYGLYSCLVASDIIGVKRKVIVKMNTKLPIKNRGDIKIKVEEICELFNQKPGNWLKDVFLKIEYNILNNKLPNKTEDLKKFILKEK